MGPLVLVNETGEYICGRCGQLLIPNQSYPTTEDIEAHFESCENAKENGLLMVFKELRIMNQKFETLSAGVSEIREEIDNNKKELNKEISDIKSEIKKDLETKCGEARVVVLSTVFKKVNALEEKMREMGAAQDTKIAEVNGRVSGVTEAISTVVHSILDVKGGKEVTPSADTNELDRLKNETEALWVQLKKSEGDIQTTKTQLEDEVGHLKTTTETVSKQLRTNNQHLQVLKRQMEDERAKCELAKKKSFHVEPSPLDQLAIPMSSFNLVTHNYLFQPSYRWTLDGIAAKLSQKTFELSSELFQWNGYLVQARAKLQLKEDNCVYISLCLKDVLKGRSEVKGSLPIPRVFYLLKDKFSRNPRHKCQSQTYLCGSAFTYSLPFPLCLVHKNWLNSPTYKIGDSVELEIYVEPSQMTQQVHSYDGTLIWDIENYAKRLQLEMDNLVFHQESPYFYTGPDGYRVQVEMYLSGIEGKGVTARVIFLSGKFDAQLPQSFSHSTTVTLINRKDPEGNISKSTVRDINKEAQYDLEMCKVEEIENFIENDTLYCKVKIEAL